MPRTLVEIRLAFESWLNAYTTRHCPGWAQDALLNAVADIPSLMQATCAFDSAHDAALQSPDGDLAHLETLARNTCLAWIAAIQTLHTRSRMAQEPRSCDKGPETEGKTIPHPGERESAYGRYSSALLGEDILLCVSRTDAAVSWDTPESPVAYFPEEIAILRKIKADHQDTFPAMLRLLHQAKRLFGGELTIETHC